MIRRFPRRPVAMLSLAALLATSLTVVELVASPEPAAAANDASLDFTKSGPATILYGEDVTYTLTATNNGTGADGYNLTFREVLPPGATFVSSSAGNPTVFADSPAAGQTTLLFENVADLQSGVSRSITVTVDLTEASFAVGSSVTNSGGAYMSGDVRQIPDFDATGAHVDNGDTSAFDTATVVTRIEAIDIEKFEPNAESELLRGVHTEWTTYSLTVDNNLVDPTDSIIVEDYLPAGLEFLGCGAVDNTDTVPATNVSATGTEEYAGAGALGVGVAPVDPTSNGVAATCETPTTVETVTLAADEEFPGQAAGVYTHVVWDLTATVGTMAPGERFELMYAAGIPLRENTATFAPGHLDIGDDTADLDNNSGPLTTDEQSLRNWSRATGNYNPGVDDLTSTAEDSWVVTAEDLSIHKSVDDGVFTQTELPGWSLLVETGEYRDATGIVVTDTLPDGQCPILSAGNPETIAPVGTECLQTGGLPAPLVDGGVDDPDTVTEDTDGSWTLVWSTVPDLGTNDDFEITFTSRVRVDYQEAFDDDTPVVGADAFTNEVDVTATTSPITDGAVDLDRVTETTPDASSAGQASSVVNIDKSVSQPTAPGVTLDCDAATFTSEAPPTPDEANWAYRPGDRVCYRIVVDFIGDLHFRNPVVSDFIPPDSVFEAFWGDDTNTGQVFTVNDAVIDEAYDFVAGPGTAPSGATDEALSWALGSTIPGGGTDLYVDNTADRFEVIFSVRLSDDPRDVTGVDIIDNLAKLTLQNNDNSGGVTFSSRDQAGYPHVEPHIVLDKRNAPTGQPTDDGAESGVQLDVFDYEVDITNDFEAGANPTEDLYASAFDIRTWDILPAGIVCADVTTAATLTTGEVVTCLDPGDGSYPLGGQATDGRSVLTMTIADLAPQETSTLSYSITVPATIAAGQDLVNDAGVRDYTGSDGNAGTTPTYVPTDNIDEDNQAAENATSARDQTTVVIPDVTVVKVQTSSDTDAGGTNSSNTPASAVTQSATIGELITYTFDVTIPEGVDLYDAVITDDLDTEIDFVSFDAGGLSLDDGATTIPLTITSATAGYFDVDGSVSQNAGDLVVAVAADDVTVTFPAAWSNAVGSLDDLVSLTFTVDVNDAPGVDAGDTIRNTVDADWNTASGDPVPTASSPRITTNVLEPNPQIAKSDDGTDTDAPADGLSNVAPGDTVTYTLEISNPDAGAGRNSAAYDLVVTDVLPDGVSFAPGVPADNPDGGVFAAGVPASAEGTITWTQVEVPALAALEVGDSLTISYTVTIDSPAVASTQLTNTSTVTAESRADDGPAANERTTYSDSDTDTVELPLAALAKDVAPFDSDPFDLTDTDTTTYAVGEAVDFEITVAVPPDNRAFDMTAFDTLPAFLEFDSYGTAVISGPECERVGGGALVAGDVVALTPDGQTAGWYLGDVFANGTECRITLPYSTHVDLAATTASTGDNAATVVWHETDEIAVDPDDVSDLDGEVWDETVGPEAETIDVIEPLLVIDKDVQVLDPGPTTCEAALDADACDTEVGATHRFTVTVTNNGDGDAHDLTVVDTLPAEGAGVPFNVTGSPAPVFDGAGPRTLTWTVTGPVAASGGSVTFTYDVVIGPSADLADDQDLVNTADVTSYWGLSTADRAAVPDGTDVPEYGGARNPVTADTNTLTVGFPDLVIQKTPAAGMDATDARVGEDFRWRLEVFNDGPVSAFDIDVDDVLPTGWLYQAGSAQIDTGGGLGALADPTGGPVGPLLWTDVVAQLDAGDSFVIEFDVQPQASLLTLGTTGTFDHVNDSGVAGDDATGESANETGGYGDDNGAPDGVHGSDDATARIRRIDLTIDKSIVESAPYFFGDFVTYRVTVTNDDSGVAVDTATDVVVTDVLPAGVVFDSAISANGAYDDTTDAWTLASPLAPGASATLDIVVRINASTTILNIAEVESASQWDIDSTPGNHDDGVGPDEDDNDSASLTPTNADLGNRIWFDVDNDGVQDAGEPGIAGIDVTVSWLDPGDGSTITLTTTTNADGEYSFTGLPQDIALTVTVDTADLPAGLSQTFELVDTPDITDTQANNAEPGVMDGIVTSITLTGANPSYLDVDFGYTGTGSIGDYVWLDDNGDGVQDGGETPLDGVDVIVQFAGFDGVLGDDPATVGVDESLDDVEYLTTTAGGGLYGVGNLAPGIYTVSIDPTTLPAGVAATHDLDGGRDRTTQVVLGAGENRDDVDFGERREADIAIAKTSSGVFAVGSDAVWTLTVTNNGPAVSEGVITVTDDIPAGLTPTAIAADDWSCVVAGQSITCDLTAGPLAVGATSTLEVTVAVGAEAAPGVVNTAAVEVTGGLPDTVPENDTDTDEVEIPLALLGIEKTLGGELVTGETVDWTLEVTNFGPSPTNDTITVTDDLPAGLAYVSAQSDDFDCAAAGQLVTCTTDVVLAVDASSTIVLTTAVTGPEGQSIVNVGIVEGGNTVGGTPIPSEVIDEITASDTGITRRSETPAQSILAITGSDVLRFVGWALILILLGCALVFEARRRRSAGPPLTTP
ncbi:MAG: isopeptide-forming domain-containing fimbrial protein [Acidimicrobiales bacterium]